MVAIEPMIAVRKVLPIVSATALLTHASRYRYFPSQRRHVDKLSGPERRIVANYRFMDDLVELRDGCI